MSAELIEAVRTAVIDAGSGLYRSHGIARAALQAIEAAGFRVVPVEDAEAIRKTAGFRVAAVSEAE